MPTLRDTEFRVYVAVLRATVGWNRPDRSVVLRYETLQRATGRSSEAVSKALRELERRGLIHVARSPRDERRRKAKEAPSESEGHH